MMMLRQMGLNVRQAFFLRHEEMMQLKMGSKVHSSLVIGLMVQCN